MIIGLGRYSRGFLCFSSGERFDVRNRILSFPGHEEHWSEEFEGTRVSVISPMFTNSCITCRTRRSHTCRSSASPCRPQPHRWPIKGHMETNHLTPTKAKSKPTRQGHYTASALCD